MKKLLFSLLVLTLPFIANSQVIDKFSDNEIHNNPVWYGETGKYEVVNPANYSGNGSLGTVATDGFVLRSKPLTTDAVVTTVNPYAYGEWRFSIAECYNWSLSTTGDFIVILMSNDSAVSKLKDGAFNFNGYFLRFQGSSSTDDFYLYKQSGTVKTEVISTLYPGTVDATAAIGRTVKITRSDLGEWKIYIDEGFDVLPTTLRGSATDNTFTTSNYFAISTNISIASESKSLYFDNLYIGPEIGDTTKPEIASVEVLSNKKLKLTFSEELDSASAVDQSNYFVDNNIGNPKFASIDLLDYKIVTLEFDSIFKDGIQNLITMNDLKDLAGNNALGLTANFTYSLIKALSATIISPTQIDVTFSQTVETTSAQLVSNYFIDNSIGNPLTATIDGTNLKLVHLVLANPLISKNSYNLSIQSVTDLNSNSILPTNFAFNYFVVSANDVVINEIFPDPTPSIGLPDYEYLELYNTTDFDIPIKDWEITVGTTTKVFPDDTIPAKGFVIICSTSAEPDFITYGKTIPILSSSLSNTGASIKLENENALLISSVTYSNTWYQDGTTGDNGKSIERIDPLNICQGIENWKASTSSFGGTPGTINSVYAVNVDTVPPSILGVSAGLNSIQITFSESVVNNFTTTDFVLVNSSENPISAIISSTNSAIVDLTFTNPFVSGSVDSLKIFNISDICGNTLDSAKKSFSYYEAQENDIVINEIMPDPDPSYGLPISEYVELYNTKNIEISLNNWTLTIGGSVKTITNLTIPANGYAIVCPTGNESLFSSYAPSNGILSSTALTITGTDITLADLNGLEINKIDYTVDWFNDDIKDDGGYSIEKIDPTNNCSGITNWRATESSIGGTPGTINSVNAINVDTISPNIESVYASDAQTLKIVFAEDIIKNLNTSNFVINNSIGNPNSVVYSADDSKTITLKFDSSFVSGEIDSLLILNVFDVCGNVTDSIQTSFLFFIANANDVVINEIMPDPDPAIAVPNSEYIELYNSTDINIPLNNWIITVGTTEKTIGNLTIPAKGYAIICPTGNESLFSSYANANGILSTTALTNSGTSIKLSDVTGKKINSVNYTDDWYQDAAKDEGGWSLEKIDPSNNCLEITNWKASISSAGGTPGAINSVNASNIDTIAPIVLSVFAENENTLQVSISEETTQNLTTANFIANYYGNPSSVEYVDSKTIKLHYDSLFESGKKDTLLILNVVDLCGNLTDKNSHSTMFKKTILW